MLPLWRRRELGTRSYLWKIHHSQLGAQPGLISVFLDFPAGRNLQPKAQWWCKGGISPPWPCLQATVVIRGSGGFGAPLAAHHPCSPWNPPEELSQQGTGCCFSTLESASTKSRWAGTASSRRCWQNRFCPFKLHPGKSHSTPDPFSAREFSGVSSCCWSLGGLFFARPKN